jgi:hypothetical protein
MLQIIEEEMTTFTFPKRYLPKIIAIITSGVLNLRGEKGVLHFDSENKLRIIEYPNKISGEN